MTSARWPASMRHRTTWSSCSPTRTSTWPTSIRPSRPSSPAARRRSTARWRGAGTPRSAPSNCPSRAHSTRRSWRPPSNGSPICWRRPRCRHRAFRSFPTRLQRRHAERAVGLGGRARRAPGATGAIRPRDRGDVRRRCPDLRRSRSQDRAVGSGRRDSRRARARPSCRRCHRQARTRPVPGLPGNAAHRGRAGSARPAGRRSHPIARSTFETSRPPVRDCPPRPGSSTAAGPGPPLRRCQHPLPHGRFHLPLQLFLQLPTGPLRLRHYQTCRRRYPGRRHLSFRR